MDTGHNTSGSDHPGTETGNVCVFFRIVKGNGRPVEIMLETAETESSLSWLNTIPSWFPGTT